MREFFIQLSTILIHEYITFFGIYFILGYILYHIQKATQRQYVQSIGWKGIYLTAWIGTPIHECMHIIMAKLFRHNIEQVSLFSPNKETGGLGHVEHSYNKKSLYQKIGLFFIGAAPLIGGTLVLVLLLRFLVPNGQSILAAIVAWSITDISPILASLQAAIPHSMAEIRMLPFTFWLFVYLSFCVVSHMAPSKQDRKHMYKGLLYLTIVIIIAQAALLLFSPNTPLLSYVYQYQSISVAVLVYAIAISLLHYILVCFLLTLPRLLWKQLIRRS